MKTRHPHVKGINHFGVLYLPLVEIVLHQLWEALSDPRDTLSLKIGSLYWGLVEEKAENIVKPFESSRSSASIRSGKGEFDSCNVVLNDGDGVFKFCEEILNKSPFKRKERVEISPLVRDEVKIVPRLDVIVKSGVSFISLLILSEYPQLCWRIPLLSLHHVLNIHKKNHNCKTIMMIGKLAVVGKRFRGSHDAVLGLRVGFLPFGAATRLVSANELSLGSLRRLVINLIIIVRNICRVNASKHFLCDARIPQCDVFMYPTLQIVTRDKSIMNI